MNIFRSMAVAAVMLLSGFAQADLQHNTSSLPTGFADARLLTDNDSRLYWHLRNETHKASMFTGSLGAGLLAAHFISSPWVNIGVNLPLDYIHSENWYDFAWRQATRAPLTLSTLASDRRCQYNNSMDNHLSRQQHTAGRNIAGLYTTDTLSCKQP